MRKVLFLVLALLVGLTPGVQAQFATGNVYGTVTDESGAVLPGAAVTITSDLGNRSTTTGTQGEFRFLNLDRGQYKVTVAIPGFTTLTRDITVTTGENVNLTFSAKVAQQEETITVTAETPLVDTKKRGTGDDADDRRAVAGAQRARPLGRAAQRAGRAARPREHRGQRERPAGQRRRQGLVRPATRCGTSTASP